MQRSGWKVPKKGGGGVQLAGLALVFVSLFLFWPLAIVGVIVIVIGSLGARALMCSVCGNGVDAGSRMCPTCHATLIRTKKPSSALAWLALCAFIGGLGYVSWQYVRERPAPRETADARQPRSDGSLRGLDFAVLAVGPDGAAGNLRAADGTETPAFVVDLTGKAVGDVWRGTLFPCGQHTFADSGRVVDRYATSRFKAAELVSQ